MGALEHRAATPDDEPFLREMLYEAIFVPPGSAPPHRSILEQPDLAHYVDGFGRVGDLGVIAVSDARDVGAAWVRLLTGVDAGYGYVDDDTPELTIAVTSAARGQGIGSQLLARLLAELGSKVPAVSLSVDPANPAVRLYERNGFTHVGASGTSITMVNRLSGSRGSGGSRRG